MAYSKTIWVDGASPALDAAHLNNIENGLEDIDVRLTTTESTISTNSTDIQTNTNDIIALENNIAGVSIVRHGTFSGTWSPTLGTTFNITNYNDYNWIVTVTQSTRTTTNGHLVQSEGYIDVDGNTVQLISLDDGNAVPARYNLIGIKKTMSDFAQVNG